MLYKAISLALVAVLLHGSIAAQDQPQSSAQTVAKMQQVLHKAQEKDKAVKVILNKKIDKQKKFSGKVSDISDTGFVVTDQKTGKPMKLAYADVREVLQEWTKKDTTILIVIGAGVVLLVLFFIGSKVRD
jgi:nickel-dependent lactate racemase